MNLKRFFVFSVVFHLSIIAAIIFLLSLPSQKNKRSGDEFSARLVSPDEFLSQKPPIPPVHKRFPSPHVSPAPIPAPVPKPLIEHKGHTGTEKNIVEEKTEKKAAMQYPSAPTQPPKPAAPESRSERPALPPAPPVAGHPGQLEKEAVPPVAHGRQENVTKETAELSGNKGNLKTPDRLQPSFREKIFDKRVIGDLAKRDVGNEEKEIKDKGEIF